MIIKQIQVFEPTIEQNPLLVCPDHTDFPHLGLQTWTGPVHHQGFHEFMRFMSSPWLSLDNDSILGNSHGSWVIIKFVCRG